MAITLISTVTVGAGGAASIDFTSIPGTYTDLMVVFSLRSNRAAAVEPIKTQFNGSTTSYSVRQLMGFGSGAGYSEIGTTDPFLGSYGANGNTTTANTFGNGTMIIPNYAGSTNKSVSVDGVYEDNVTAAWQDLTAGLWASTAAINRVTLTPLYGTLWNQYSSASLYGVLKGSSGGVTVA